MNLPTMNSLAAVSRKGVTGAQSSADDQFTTNMNGHRHDNQPNLNILNQASNISELSASHSIFDPTQNAVNHETRQMTQQVVEGVLNSFSGLVLQDNNNNGSAAVGSTTSPKMIPLQQPQQQHMPIQVVQQLFQTNPTALTPVSPAHAAHGAVTVQQVPTLIHHALSHPNQPHHVQTLQPKTSIQNGRVPATKHDNRKLFVGGLPNEVTDFTFLQFFSQYGEVVDSIVLLDRRTKRSRGFGFVTFADESVSNSLLNVIPGRTGTVNILGKNCEIKASEPKSEEFYQQQPHFLNQHHHQHHQNQSQWGGSHHTPQRLVFGRNGTSIHPNTDQSVSHQHLNYPGADQGAGAPLYSHSTITRTTAGPILSADGSPQEGTANIYIQNNFYTLPPGTQLSPSHPLNAAPTMENLQQREEELVNCGGTVTYTYQQSTLHPVTSGHAPFEYPGDVFQPAYPGPERENSPGDINIS